MTTKDRKIEGGFAVCGALLTLIFVVVVNQITSPSYPWFVFPAFAVVWWPVSVIVPRRFGVKAFSTICAGLTIAFLCTVNEISSPFYPWVLFAVFPLLLWPVLVFSGKTAAKPVFAAFLGAAAALYYVILNLTIAKGFPWSMFIVYALLWWPLALLFARKGRLFGFSVAGTVITSVLFYALNLLTTPHEIWFVYPVFAMLWWPLSLYFFSYRKDGSGMRA